jgi:hypothetical protein
MLKPAAAEPGPDPKERKARTRARRHSRAASWVLGIVLALAGLFIAGLFIAAANSSSGNSSPAAAPSSSALASAAPCTSNACIATNAEVLKGTVAKDYSVMTNVTCSKSTVKEVVSSTYTVHCTVSYSDGSMWDGIASVLISKNEVDWEPTTMVSAGSSGN